RSLATICSAECLVRFIFESLRAATGGRRDSHSWWIRIRGAGQLHIIAALLAEGVRRRRADACRMGEIPQHQEREADGLEPFGPVRLDRPPPPLG
ncbi:MAG: hypothetical protein ACT4PL_13935, partial [Phycisphaerales bacterium]